MNSVVVLLTGTIKPAVLATSVQPDPVVRAREYHQALERVARQIPRGRARIIFAENSGVDPIGLFDFCQSAGIEVAIHTDDSGEALARGKGAGELALMRKVVASGNFDDDQMFVKVTGRLELLNLADFVELARRADFDAAFRLDRRSGFADSRIFIFRKRFFAILDSCGAAIDDDAGFHLEHALAQSADIAHKSGLRWRFLPIFPRFRGYSGTNGNAYYTGFWGERLQWLKFHLYRLRAQF